MPTTIDLVLVAALALALPIYEHIMWPRTVARIRREPHRGRVRAYASTILMQWTFVAICAWSWRHGGRGATALGLVMPTGWELWPGALAVLIVVAISARNVRAAARSDKVRAHLRQAIADLDFLMPHTLDEASWFLAVSLTAGICEEFLFRGFFIGVLAPVVGWWGAAALNVPVFGLLHAYQGRKGIVKTAVVGAVMTVIVAVTHSLYPAMIVHVTIDAGSGLMLWLALREPTAVGAP